MNPHHLGRARAKIRRQRFGNARNYLGTYLKALALSAMGAGRAAVGLEQLRQMILSRAMERQRKALDYITARPEIRPELITGPPLIVGGGERFADACRGLPFHPPEVDVKEGLRTVTIEIKRKPFIVPIA